MPQAPAPPVQNGGVEVTSPLDVEEPADRIAWLENPWNERTSFSCDAAGRRTLKKLANGTRLDKIADCGMRSAE